MWRERMSDIPELDEIISESENIRFNKRWDKKDRFFRRSLGYMLLATLSIFPLGLLLGNIGILIGAVLFSFSIFPLFIVGLAECFSFCFKESPV